MNTERKEGTVSSGNFQKNRPAYWIALLTGNREPQSETPEQARDRLTEWWRFSAERMYRQIPQLPEDFRTTRVWRHIKFVDNYFTRLKPVCTSLEAGTCDLTEAVKQVRSVFSDEEDRLMKWKHSLDNLQGLILWLPAFSHAREYLLGAFPLGRKDTDVLCQSLLRSIRDPYPFLEAGIRERFDESFLNFKKKYIEDYCSLHEEIRSTVQDVKKEESRVDTVALRNLELLSRLQYTDKSYMNRVNVLANWIKRNQCTLPVSRILERYPRCYCNFNPCSMRQPVGPVDQINEIIREGIGYFQTVLSRCWGKLQTEIQKQNPDESVSSQIDAILSNNTLIPLKDQTIDTINRIIRKNPTYYYALILSRPYLDDSDPPKA